jgi:hypothetical protein
MLYLKLFLAAISAICVMSAPTLETQAPTDCAKFLTSSQKAYVPGAFPCVEAPSKPSTIAGHTVELYHWSGSFSKAHYALVQKAVVKTLNAYASFSDPFDVKVIFARSFVNDNLGVEDNMPGDQDDCVILLPDMIPPADLSDSLERLRTVAHELYHCVEIRNVPKKDTNADFEKSSSWWFEGGASYFASQLYAETQDGHFSEYDPKLPLYSEAYGAELFFLSLTGQGWDAAKVNGFIKKQQLTTDYDDERNRLAKDPDIPKVFPLFGQAFYDNTIKLSSGRVVTARTQLQPAPLSIQLSESSPTAPPYLFNVDPFTFKVVEIDLQGKGSHYSVTWSGPGPGTTVYYKSEKDTKWDDLKQGTKLLAPVGCQDSHVKYTFLITSTDDTKVSQPSVTFKIAFAQQDDCCQSALGARDGPPASCPTNPQPPSSTGMDPCLVGTWELNLPTFQAAVAAAENKATAGTGVTIGNLTVGGASTFTVDGSTAQTTMTFDHTTIGYDASDDAIGTFHTDIDINGKASGPIVVDQSAGTFHWNNVVVDGTVDTNTVIQGESPITTNDPLSGNYPVNLVIAYTCAATSLTLTGSTAGGKYVWSYAYDKAS